MIRCLDADLQKYLDKKKYNLKTMKSAEVIDVLCEPDLMSVVSDCIVKYLEEKKKNIGFSAKSIYVSDFCKNNILGAFKKKELTPAKQVALYENCFTRPMKFLAYIGVLEEAKEGVYKVVDNEMLEFFSIKVRNCFRVLNMHAYKILKDSGINRPFDLYFINSNEQNFTKMKNFFIEFVKKELKIEKPAEIMKYFSKIVNLIAYSKNTFGTAKGKMMKIPMPYDQLMYQQAYYTGTCVDEPIEIYRKYTTRRAKNFILRCNEMYRAGKTEVYQKGQIKEKGTAAHHIFPEGKFPQLAEYYENQIVLTNEQHMTLAHPDGDTQTSDPRFQRICLFAKIETIKESISKSEGIYLFSNLIKVLSIGLGTDSFKDIKQLDFDEVCFRVTKYYGNI